MHQTIAWKIHKIFNAGSKMEIVNAIRDMLYLYDISWLSHVSSNLITRCKIEFASAIQRWNSNKVVHKTGTTKTQQTFLPSKYHENLIMKNFSSF